MNYLTALQVKNSVYEYVVYDSEVEREFAKKLDEREDIKLFVKLPRWFTIPTPLGEYNPDWAIVKHDGQTLYLVRETKGTKDFLKLRTSEADKIRCGKRTSTPSASHSKSSRALRRYSGHNDVHPGGNAGPAVGQAPDDEPRDHRAGAGHRTNPHRWQNA